MASSGPGRQPGGTRGLNCGGARAGGPEPGPARGRQS